MHKASIERCKELFEVSGWNGTQQHWYQNWLDHDSWHIGHVGQADEKTYPAYDLGYLLRKLPQNSWVGYTDTSGHRGYALANTYAWNEKGNDIDKIAECRDDTPEDALCLLAIGLFQQGLLKRDQEEERNND